MADRLDLEAVKARHEARLQWVTDPRLPPLAQDMAALISEVEALREALKQVAHPMATFAGPQCCADTFADACELFSDIARAVLPET